MRNSRARSGMWWRKRHRIVAASLCAAATLLLPLLLRTPAELREEFGALRGASTDMSVRLPPPPVALRGATHLIVVAGHAVYTAIDRSGGAVARESSWFLEPFQRGQLSTMLAHIRRGVELAAADNASVLLFSGGQTRAAAGPRSEGESYWEAAEASGWFGRAEARPRAHIEDQARDSLENLLFSLCRFHEITGRYPRRVTMVSFEFKRHRFTQLHARALRLPTLDFDGIDPPDLGDDVRRGETERSAHPFEADPYGCNDGGLRAKRASRNPFRRSISYPLGCPELAPLISACPRAIYTGPLPWDAYV